MLANDTTATFTLPDCWNDCLKVKGVMSDEWEPKKHHPIFLKCSADKYCGYVIVNDA
jgi:hypothetical protein